MGTAHPAVAVAPDARYRRAAHQHHCDRAARPAEGAGLAAAHRPARYRAAAGRDLGAWRWTTLAEALAAAQDPLAWHPGTGNQAACPGHLSRNPAACRGPRPGRADSGSRAAGRHGPG